MNQVQPVQEKAHIMLQVKGPWCGAAHVYCSPHDVTMQTLNASHGDTGFHDQPTEFLSCFGPTFSGYFPIPPSCLERGCSLFVIID